MKKVKLDQKNEVNDAENKITPEDTADNSSTEENTNDTSNNASEDAVEEVNDAENKTTPEDTADNSSTEEKQFIFTFLFSVIENGKEKDKKVSSTASSEGEALRLAIKKITESTNDFIYKDILSKVEN